MKAPKKVMDLVEKKLEAKREREEREIRAQEAKNIKNRELRALKESQRDELMDISQKITNWLEEFYKSEDGQAILNISASVNVFLAKFWNGYPITVPDKVCYALIVFNRNGEIVYKETHKGRASQSISLGLVYESAAMPFRLKNYLHPEFLRQWEQAIETGKVWECIESSIY